MVVGAFRHDCATPAAFDVSRETGAPGFHVKHRVLIVLRVQAKVS